MKKAFVIDKDSFTRVWYCEVYRSGYHNGSKCKPDHTHFGWNCGWRYELHISYDEASFEKEFGL